VYVAAKIHKIARSYVVLKLQITHQLTGPFFRPIDNDSPVTFFVLPALTAFHGIIGDDTFKSLNAIIDRKKNDS